MYRRQIDRHYVVLSWLWIARGMPVSTVAYLLEVKPDTVRVWLALAVKRADYIEQVLRGRFKLPSAEIEQLWARTRRPGYEETYRAAIAAGRVMSRKIREGNMPLYKTMPPLALTILRPGDFSKLKKRYRRFVQRHRATAGSARRLSRTKASQAES